MAVDLKDNNLICLFKNIDFVLKIERYTRNIIWILDRKEE